MWNDILTPDNTPLSRVKNAGLGDLGEVEIAINCKLVSPVMPLVTGVSAQVADLLSHSLSANTERAYHSDLSHFRDWGGSIPATPAMVCTYIAGHAGQLSVATIQRRIATVSKAHETLAVQNPCRNEIVRATLRGLRRKHGTAQKQAIPCSAMICFWSPPQPAQPAHRGTGQAAGYRPSVCRHRGGVTSDPVTV